MIFPMFEFELPRRIETFTQLETELLEYLVFGAASFLVESYQTMAGAYQV